MIPLHRLTHPEQPIYVNPDLVQVIESTPDTVLTMTNQSKVIVLETPAEVTELICRWRASIYARALGIPQAEPADEARILPFPHRQ